MPKLVCKCKNILDLSPIPCRDQYLFISDMEFDTVPDELPAGDLYSKFELFFECPNCERLWVYWNGFSNPPKIYQLE